MQQDTSRPTEGGSRELVLFQASDILCGLDTIFVQEVIEEIEIRVTPRAPAYVRGVINLRGEIVTVIDLRAKLGDDRPAAGQAITVVIVKSGNEIIGLAVDSVSDVVTADANEIELPPANVSGLSSIFFQGIFKMEKELVAILDIAEVLKV